MSKIIIVGGGPAGSIAAITLRKLGQEVELFEKGHFPRYRIGESLLPGTLSVLQRLGLSEKIEAAHFVKKPSATFLWGAQEPPWTFSFATARSAPWICDHSIQVMREEFDALLWKAAGETGAVVHNGAPVSDTDVSRADRVSVKVQLDGRECTREADYLIDASGADSPLVRKLGVRRYDSFYRSLAVWSYFKRPDPFRGDLRGTTYSITFKEGWVWMIPLKGDLYSVGLIVDHDRSKELSELGPEAFFRQMLRQCRRAMDILQDAEQVDVVRVVQDWSYQPTKFSDGRFFLCGDSACFTDPLFSQGVHLATQSAVCASSAISRLSVKPEETGLIHDWYNRSYGETYEQYHEFLASFYTFASFTEPESEYWRKRRIVESDDLRLERKQWFERLVAKAKQGDISVEDFRDRASTMIAIGRHTRPELSDDFADAELNPARLRWMSELTKKLNSIRRMEWQGREVALRPSYKVNPNTFQLETRTVIGNEASRVMSKFPLEEEQRKVFESLLNSTVGYRELVQRLSDAGRREISTQIVIRTMEAGLIRGYDRDGRPVLIQDRLRFDGVGEEYEV